MIRNAVNVTTADDLRRSLVSPGTAGSGSNAAGGSSTRNGDVLSAVPAAAPALEKEYLRKLASRNLAITLTCTSCMLMLYG